MTHPHGITLLTGVLCLVVAMAWAQDRITEEDVVRALNGKPHTAAPGQRLGVALHVTFSPQAAGAKGNHALTGDTLQANEVLYKTLIPLARALEGEVVRGSRFVIRAEPNSPLPVEDAKQLGQQLTDHVEHFLTTYFAIPREWLNLQVALPPLTEEEAKGSPPGLQRWRLEVFRQE
jgi:hypothetical protein